jgi:lipopolysaccharide biosynthesis regulator YciM
LLDIQAIKSSFFNYIYGVKARFWYLFLLFAVFGICRKSAAQTTFDSLLNVLKHHVPDTEKVNTMIRITNATADTALIMNYELNALDLSRKIGFKKGEASANVALGNFYEHYQLHVTAVRYYTEALKIREETGDKKGIAQCYVKLAVIDGKFKNYNKAILLLRKAKALNLEIKNQNGVSLADQSLAQMYQSDEKWDSAIFYYHKTLDVPEQNIVTIAVTYINLISVYIGKQQFDSAIVYIHKCDSVYGILHNNFGPLWNRMNMGQIYLLKGDTKHAIEFLEPVYAYGEKQDNADLLFNVLPILIDAYRKNGDAVKGFRVQTEWIQLKDSLENTDQANAILGEQIKYEQDQKEKIDNLQKAKDKSENDAKANRQQLILYSVSGFLVLVLGMMIFVFRSYRQKKRANEIISGQKTLVEEKQKEILDSIHYAKRIQQSLLPTEKYIDKSLNKFRNGKTEN